MLTSGLCGSWSQSRESGLETDNRKKQFYYVKLWGKVLSTEGGNGKMGKTAHHGALRPAVQT